MDSNPAPSKLGRHGGRRTRGRQVNNINLKTRGGTSREYLLRRLERDGRHELLDGVRNREITVHAAAVEAGYIRRRETRVIDGDHNLTRWREHRMAEVLDRAPSPSYAHAELPCFNCRAPQAWRALAEVADTYLRARRGESSRTSMSGVLPMACCRRQRLVSVETLIA